MAKKKSRIPRFRTDEEERTFWSQHSFEEFADEMEEVDVVINPTPEKPAAVADLVPVLRSLPKPDAQYWDTVEEITKHQPPMPSSPWER